MEGHQLSANHEPALGVPLPMEMPLDCRRAHIGDGANTRFAPIAWWLGCQGFTMENPPLPGVGEGAGGEGNYARARTNASLIARLAYTLTMAWRYSAEA